MSIAVEEIWTSSNTWYVGPIRPTDPNGISIKSAVFTDYAYMFVTDGQTDRQNERTNAELDRLRAYVQHDAACKQQIRTARIIETRLPCSC